MIPLDPKANIIEVYVWILFYHVLALAWASEKDYIISKSLCHRSEHFIKLLSKVKKQSNTDRNGIEIHTIPM